ncbi:Aste57867_4753 [Aphanomyces stellatus]|uniref:Aste57867_4753 protein n=1 Tax=Aphanomyces stellatus TaxID=120398 RepID=A0A485KGB9_9STRA|nr:hypothetical protein As57867_004740 [Aphanomyces stellatus]VFT81849.1 Aste57867_4753 [Aphanomyces stellatus]
MQDAATRPACEFKSCTNVAAADSSKCSFHRHRAACSIVGCFNQVYARRRCARHGGKRPCSMAGCGANAQGNAFCVLHGGVPAKKPCTVVGCAKHAQSGQRCLRHGGGRRCAVDDCSQYVRSGGRCLAHQAKRDDDSQCKYAYKACTHTRATKKDGTLHTLCDFHRAKTNAVQQQYNRKKKHQHMIAMQSLDELLQIVPDLGDLGGLVDSNVREGASVQVAAGALVYEV